MGIPDEAVRWSGRSGRSGSLIQVAVRGIRRSEEQIGWLPGWLLGGLVGWLEVVVVVVVVY